MVRTPEGIVVVDTTGRQNGKGAYLKLSLEVIERAKISKALDRALEVEVPNGVYEELKNLIIENEGNKGFAPICPVCGSKLITRVAKMYDLEDNLMLHPKARCSKCPFQIT